MSDKVTHERLSNDDLQRIIAEHQRYKATDGKQGRQADLSVYTIEDFDFSGLDLSEIHAQSSIFTRCRFIGCDLYAVDFSNSSLRDADFSNSTLAKASFYEVDARGARFDHAKMSQVEFIKSDLRGASFRDADLSSYIISECDTTDTNFEGTPVEAEMLAVSG